MMAPMAMRTYSNQFTEDGAAVPLTNGSGTISDVDDTSFVNLSVDLGGAPTDGADEVLVVGGTAIPLDGSSTPATVTVGEHHLHCHRR